MTRVSRECARWGQATGSCNRPIGPCTIGPRRPGTGGRKASDTVKKDSGGKGEEGGLVGMHRLSLAFAGRQERGEKTGAAFGKTKGSMASPEREIMGHWSHLPHR